MPAAEAENGSWPAGRVRRVVANHLRANAGRLGAEMAAEICAKIPEYGRPADEAYAKNVRVGVDLALQRFLDLLDGRDSQANGWHDLYREIGARELREGRSLDALHATIRLCARIAWQRLIDDADRESIPLGDLDPLAETIFAYLDDLAAVSAQGFAHAKAAEIGELDRRRRRLVTLLTAASPASPEAIASAASAARWSMPARLAVVALDASAALAVPPVLPPDILADFARSEPCLVLPDPDAPRQARDLSGHLAGHRAAVGPSVPPARAAASLRLAAGALDLMRRGVIRGNGVVWCRDHLATMAIFQDEQLLDALMERRLEPLMSQPPAQRAALGDTLLAWLQTNGNANQIAAGLHIHPQTARHRLRQLTRIFGDVLQDADARFELQIALRADRVRRARPPA